MTVYLDAVFVLNFCINALLLRGAARLGAAAPRTGRIALGAVLGAVYAVLVYLPGLRFLSNVPCKLLCAAGMLLAAYGPRRSTLRLAAVFAALTLTLCGAVYGVLLLRGESPRGSGKALFYPVSFATLLLTAAAVSAACRLLLPRLCHGSGLLAPVTLRLMGKSVRLTALRDTGNTLCDPVSGAPVMTVYWQAARRLFPLPLTDSDFALPADLAVRLRELSPRLIPYRAVGVANGLLLALPCEVTIGTQTKRSFVAFSPTPLSAEGAYDALTGGMFDA